MTKLSKKTEENPDYLEQWKRERANFLNYRAEESERIERAISFARQELILGVIEILDNIHIAQSNLPDDLKENQWVVGILKTKEQIRQLLRNYGVEEIETPDQFDPHCCEAIETVESQKDSGSIVEVVKRGYSHKGKIIRPIKVKIAK